MHHKLDKDVVLIYDKEDNIKEAFKLKKYKKKYNSDLVKVLLTNWEYKTKYHNTPQLDFNL